MDIPRWHLRHDNLRSAFALLAEAIDLLRSRGLSALESEGLIQRFEYSWELAWKTLRDLLIDRGVTFASITPANVIRAAFAASLLSDGDAWLDAMKARNQISHEYDRAAFDRVIIGVREKYFPLLEALMLQLEIEREQ